MDNISSALYKSIKETYKKEISSNQEIKNLLKKMKKENTNYKDAMDFAECLGNCLKKAFAENVTHEMLPNGKMPYLVAKEIIEPILKENYEIIAKQCVNVQNVLNKAANLGLKGIKPSYSQDRTNGIVDYVSKNEYKVIEKSFQNSLVTNSRSIVDTSVKENADFHYKSGLNPKIVRKSQGKCCRWCTNLIGTYDYADVKDTGNDVFRRHSNCRCIVLYDPGDGSKKIQDVWSKKISYKKDILNTDSMGRKTSFDIDMIKSKNHLITYKNDKYLNIYCQTNTNNAQKMSEYLDKMINQSNQYGEISNIVIVKNKVLQGIASYDHINNNLYISEELVNQQKFLLFVDKTYFPARNIEDILNHELGGHKRHWQAIGKYQKKYDISTDKAKQELEENLRKYVVNQRNNDILYIKKYVSENADDKFEKYNSLNELIADINVLNMQDKVKDKYLLKLVMEVLNYDG